MLFADIAVKPSTLEGRGLFAGSRIKKGAKVLRFDGAIITWDKAVELGVENHAVPVGIDKYVNTGEPELLINHSCEPNTGFENDDTLIALKDLAPGEELTFDYSLVTADGWTMRCSCGTSSCRGIISDYAQLSESLKKKYRSITPPWILALNKK